MVCLELSTGQFLDNWGKAFSIIIIIIIIYRKLCRDYLKLNILWTRL